MSMLLPPFELHAPKTVKDAVALAGRLGPGNFDWVAGGTDLLPNYKWGLNGRKNVISLHDTEELRARELRPDGSVRLGALITLTNLVDDAELAAALPVLPKTAATIASPLLRNSGTLGGNLCLDTRCYYFNQGYTWRKSKDFCLKADGDVCLVVPQKTKCYANFSADMAAPLIALNATIELAGPSGTRRVPLRDFYKGDGIERFDKKPDELVTFVDIPKEARDLRATYLKLRQRESWDFPELGIAAALRIGADRKLAGGSLVANAVGTTPLVLDDVLDAHHGSVLDDALIDRIAAEVEKRVMPVKNTTFPPVYRKKMARVFTKRALREISP